MKKLLIICFYLLNLSSCYETDINTTAILYDHESTFEIKFNVNAPVGGASLIYFGLNNTYSNTESNTNPYKVIQDNCLISYSFDITSTSIANSSSLGVSINSSRASDIALPYTGGTGLKSKSANININKNDLIRVYLEGAAMSGTLISEVTLLFGPCQ